MARMLPANLLPGTPSSETKVYAAFAKLPDTWTVIHGVAWQHLRNGRPGDGEADFVLLHPAHGMVTVEVKGGGIVVDGSAWYSDDRRGERHRIKSPFEQAVGSKKALLAFLKDRRAFDGFLPSGHLVVFSDLQDLGGLGPAAPAELVWCRPELGQVRASMDRLVAHWELTSRLGQGDVDRIVRLLAPSVDAQPLIRDRVADVIEQQIHLTNEQVALLESLRRNRRAVVYGSAGTGKTVLAVERARRLAESGHRVLLTCFNRPLGDLLTETFQDDERVHAVSFHRFCFEQATAAGRGGLTGNSPEWFAQGLPSLMLESAEELGTRFDAIVVDEGQDFEPTWWDLLALLLEDPDQGPFYVFTDPKQGIYDRPWQVPFPATELDLTVNCRNTLEIGEVVAAVYGDEVLTRGAAGPLPCLHVVPDFKSIGDRLRHTMHHLLIEERLDRSKIVVLTDSKRLVSFLHKNALGPHRFVPAGERNGIATETIHRFKGLESEAVVLVLTDLQEDQRALLYVGLSRARAYLEVIATDPVAGRLPSRVRTLATME